MNRFDIHRARENTAGVDAALATFKNNLAAMDRERESKMYASDNMGFGDAIWVS